ncbi:MAG: asparagine synthase (glutamine-hydrolyzing) [Chitinophagales bacterium]
MCGIAGFISEINIEDDILEAVADSLKHRGPDAYGVFNIPGSNTCMVHTRLSFFDLSDKGNQPMHFQELGLTISYNGEVYNFREIRKELEQKGYTFISDSDTEVVLKAWHAWGTKSIDRFKGMFAFAIYDSKNKKLHLVRDRFGIKPLYYTHQKNTFGFASELKALRASGLFQMDTDWSAVCDFMVYRYVPSPKSIYENVHKLPPAHYLEYDTVANTTAIHEYWKLESGNKKDPKGELPAMVDEFLRKSVQRHSRADVPVGMFLSGGYDSSAIAAYLKQNNYPHAQAFSIGFENWERSEHQYAQIVANHLDIPLQSQLLDATSLDYVDEMPQVYDEPIADISIVPTYLVSKLARKNVKAVLSGEGADEIFGGYWWQKEYYRITHPKSIKGKIKQLINGKADPVKFYADAASMGEFNVDELKKLLHPDLHQYIPEDPLWFYRKHLKKEWSPLKQMQYMDIKCFMAELILVKVDRASMANSLEVRVPFLDHELFETIFSYHEDAYYKSEVKKYCLHENIKGKLPQSIINREKQGFVGPDQYYMKKDFYSKVFQQSKLKKQGTFSDDYLDHLMNKPYDWRKWKIAVMDKWFDKWMA